MNISTVNELIQSLESAGELSIKESKYLELAKEYQQLAAENVGLKAAISAVSRTAEECEVNGDELKYVVEPAEFEALTDLLDETPATDRIVAGIKADGVEEFVSNTVHKIFDESDAVPALAYLSLANSHVKQLREGADK
ncbi:hypothetical protein [Klebsiella oxytoca]|uniref:hypothetical protein n=1 Tax=Klebsiella oxytoca TaxID=571 RepID=UPI002A363D8A|nr:hypothetical protein [Klebsiella oxytoca]MCE5368457.1 hypothetical protein [Klebsiella oxytoca]